MIKKVKGRGPKIVRDCPICGQKFEALAYKVRKGLSKYCSSKCAGTSFVKRVTVACPTCDKSLTIRSSSLRNGRKFCSPECVWAGTTEIRRENMLRHWSDPETRQHHVESIRKANASMSEEKRQELAKKSSATKRKRVKEDPEYHQRLVDQARAMTPKSHTPEAKAKRLKTINERYTKEEQREWSRKAMRAVQRKHGGPWNKGLTKETDPRVAAAAKKLIGHEPAVGSGFGKVGIREDLNLYVRSTWEANIARLFRHFNIDFQYEPKVFEFYNHKGEVVQTYRPDFFLPKYGLWIEVSGWVTKSKKDKLSQFQKHYPDANLFHLTKPIYIGLRNMFGLAIENWEWSKLSGKGDARPLLAIFEL